MAGFTVVKQNTLKGIYFGLLAFLIWSCGDAATKFVGKGQIPFTQIIVVGNFVGICCIAFFSACTGGLQKLKPTNLKLQLLMAVVITLLSPVNVISFTQLPMTTCYAAWFASPLVVALLSDLLLHEKMTRKKALLVFAGFMGVLIAINPFTVDLQNDGTFWGWILLPFGPLLFAVYMLMSRFLRLTDTSESISFFPTSLRCLFYLPFALYFWVPMTGEQVLATAWMGMSMAVGALLMSKALAMAPASTVSPLHYSQLLVGAILDFSIWNIPPTWHMILGGVIIVVTGVAGARLAARQETVRQAVFEDTRIA